jgi:hypothetical protein
MSFELGSTTSLSQRDLSQEDGVSTNSGQSSVDLHGPVDDSERLALLASAVSWIKEELVSGHGHMGNWVVTTEYP